VSPCEGRAREPATALSRTGTLTKRRDEQLDMGFRNLPHPFVCCVLIDDPTPDGVLRTMKLAEYEGADAFDLELQSLKPTVWTACGLWKSPRRSSLLSATGGGEPP
jgi:hypothetical protein